MTILEIIQDAALELGLRYPEAVVGTSDLHARQLLAYANDEVQALLDDYPWPQLTKTATFTLVAGQERYALPGDFDQQIFNTNWDSSEHWRLLGPVTADEWQQVKSGISELTPRRIFRIKGSQNNQLHIHPVPGLGDDGKTLVFEYLSKQAIVPAAWTSGASYAGMSYTSYDDNIYYTTSGGETGVTAPSHTSGSMSDGSVNWTYVSAPYVKFLKDTDTPKLPARIIKLGIKWRFRSARRLDAEQEYKDYKTALTSARSKLAPARDVRLGGPRNDFRLGDMRNVPDHGFG